MFTCRYCYGPMRLVEEGSRDMDGKIVHFDAAYYQCKLCGSRGPVRTDMDSTLIDFPDGRYDNMISRHRALQWIDERMKWAEEDLDRAKLDEKKIALMERATKGDNDDHTD